MIQFLFCIIRKCFVLWSFFNSLGGLYKCFYFEVPTYYINFFTFVESYTLLITAVIGTLLD